MKKRPLFFVGTLLLIVLASLLIGCSASESKGLPSEAEQALSSWAEGGYSGDKVDYTIVSAQKATEDSGGDEAWCVVTDTELRYGSKHFILRREELNWQVFYVTDSYSFSEGEFLKIGCDNW